MKVLVLLTLLAVGALLLLAKPSETPPRDCGWSVPSMADTCKH
jgi:hypothetical protein